MTISCRAEKILAGLWKDYEVLKVDVEVTLFWHSAGAGNRIIGTRSGQNNMTLVHVGYSMHLMIDSDIRERKKI